MPPYLGAQHESLWWIYGMGLALALAVVLARGSRFFLKPRDEEIHEFPGGVSEGYRPVTVFFVLVLIGFALWAVGYVIFNATVSP